MESTTGNVSHTKTENNNITSELDREIQSKEGQRYNETPVLLVTNHAVTIYPKDETFNIRLTIKVTPVVTRAKLRGITTVFSSEETQVISVVVRTGSVP